MDPHWTVLVIFLVTQVGVVNPQGTGPEATQNFQFYMDTTRDCNGPVYNVFDKQAVLRGQSSASIQQSPLTCTIKLNTENNFEKTTFRVTVNAMNIDDCDVTFAIYDGEPGQPLIDSYDCNKGKTRTEMFTTGNRVSFVLTRRDERNTRYDIEVIAKPLVAGQDPGYENGFGDDYGYYNRLVPNMVIYIIVGVLFFIIIVVIIIVGIVCHRRHKGLNKPAERYNISYINTGTSRGPASTNTRNWVSTSRTSLQRDRNQKHRHHSDDDSVFDGSVDSMPSKKRYDADKSFDTYQSQGRNYRPDRHDVKQDRYRNPSYDDEHPPSRFIQREITPRAKSKPQKYEPEEEEDEVESVGVGPDEEEEEEVEEEETEEEEEDEEEEEEEDDDDQEDAGEPSQPQPLNLPEHPPPRLGHPSMSGIPQPIPRHPHDQPHSYPADPRHMPVNPQQMAGPYGPRFVMYPGQPGPQFMPMAPGPGQFQPIQGHPNMPPPRYPGDGGQQQPQKPFEVKPSDPPIYSYLVQRGYHPVDGRDSPVSVSTNASGHSDTRLIQPDDSDMSSHNLAAGVEFMRR
ncbi:uncharacterized protein LOC124144267 [Haliotis rufescens]|uniref:uncharacterized protein LOC124144267 n=1 Tax=Haliotis rufescens TaxID=6454 RepID=UPI00201F1CC3|nr:uncharacterized protein LOC124144267 [Haliotis rufescens]XP_048252756.1 uncharacterized protein LOC124144267 [Haliotis rufescens]